jgi:hypothetical protein
MSTLPTDSPESQAQQLCYLCPQCNACWSLRDVRYCCACRDCGSGLIIILEEQSVVIQARATCSMPEVKAIDSDGSVNFGTARGATDEQPEGRPFHEA